MIEKGYIVMSWMERHRESERLASQAQVAIGEGKRQEAIDLYARSADAEVAALDALDESRTRTRAISVVSAVSLYFKASEYEKAVKLAQLWLKREDPLPRFAVVQLKELETEALAALVESVQSEGRVRAIPAVSEAPLDFKTLEYEKLFFSRIAEVQPRELSRPEHEWPTYNNTLYKLHHSQNAFSNRYISA